MGKQTPEGAVKSAICQYLDIRRIMWVRMNAGATVLTGANGKRRFIQHAKAGTSDVLAFPMVPVKNRIARDGDGCTVVPMPLWIEVKRESGGRVSEAQRAFLASVEALGHLTLVATSIDDVERKLKEVGAL